MTKSILTLTAISALTLGLGACSTWEHTSPTSKPPGTYKSSSERTNANGTTVKTDETTYVYKDGSGNKKAVVETKTTKDPEGLFNKQTSKTVKTYN